ncbi:MAG: hypothetical protein EKK39_02235 [Sphingobacteriales bacterium]|uniref:hypothetical protein n=1 Tax=Hydrotalea flava TaxID=714549 RepID=UPI0008372A44|nr:hypothetical protein [Hydrotalea flava]RTL55825.1 MAG: hypothetical protein EKK39_02235 [Sphingobacteriales bacterium]
MQKLKLLSVVLPVLVAVVLVLLSNTAKAQTASCAAAKQTCYKVTLGGVTVKSVSGLATIKL